MTLAVAFAVVLPAAVTYSTLRLIGVARLLALSLAPAFALGISSAIYFFLLLSTTAGVPVLFDTVLWLVAFGGSMLLWARRMRRTPSPRVGGASGAGPREWKPLLAVAATACMALVVMAAAAVWLHMRVMPHGETDAIAIWNLRARSLARGAPEWAAILSPAIGWSHPDYPLMLPLTIARLWSYAGSETNAVPQLVALLFFGSSVATVGVSVARLCGATAGLLSAMTVVAARTYVFQVSCQCGDVPIGFFILVAVIFVLARDSDAQLPVAGAAAGMAAWTKNEGQLVFVVVAVFAAIAFRNRLSRLRPLLLGSAIPLAALAIFKLVLAPPSLFVDQPGDAIVDKVFDVGRWRLVLTQTWGLLQRWGNVPGGALVWGGLAVVLAARADRLAMVRSAAGALLVLGMLGGYLVAYAITPLPLSWHIATSFERLVVQLWPAAVWSAFQLTAGQRRMA